MSLLLTIFKQIISMNNFLSLKLLIVTELYCRNGILIKLFIASN